MDKLLGATSVARFICLLGSVTLLHLALTGCAGGYIYPGSELNPEKVKQVVRTALEDVQDTYIKETELSDLAKAGLRNVSKDHPPTEVTESEDAVAVSYDKTELHRIVWNHTDDSEFWATQTSLSLQRLHEAFPPEAAPSFNALADSFLAGVAGSLELGGHYVPFSRIKASSERIKDGVGTLNITLVRMDGLWLVKGIHNADLRESRALRIDDAILEIDGVILSGFTSAELDELVRGEIGSPITLTIQREGIEEPVRMTLARARHGTKPIGTYPDGKVLRIFVAQFTWSSIEELKEVLAKIIASSAKDYEGIILDLRGHPGGLLFSAIELADTFIEQGRIVSTHGRHPESHQYFSADDQDVIEGMPLAVLVDENTTVGAEFVAAALQDFGRAIVVGSTTRGMGQVRTVLRLPNQGELIFTWAEVVTAGRYSLDKRGVLPTVCTGGETGVGSVLAALRNGGGITDRATRTREIDSEEEAALKAHRALCPSRTDGEGISLEVAKAILEEPGLYEKILALDQKTEEASLH